jgi:hypothetical protein
LLPHRCGVPPPSAGLAVAALCLGVLTVGDCRLGSLALLERPCSRIAAVCRRLQLGLLWRLFAGASALSVTAALVRPRCLSVLAPASPRCVAAFSCACCGGSLPRRLHCRDYRLGSPALLERPCSRITALCRHHQLCLLPPVPVTGPWSAVLAPVALARCCCHQLSLLWRLAFQGSVCAHCLGGGGQPECVKPICRPHCRAGLRSRAALTATPRPLLPRWR